MTIEVERNRLAASGTRTPVKRIHITGTPRSGTTLLLSLMLACFDIDGGVTVERRLWRTPPKGKRVVCTKFPDETDFAGSMLKFDPDLHVIFIVRDPRDVVVSKRHPSNKSYLTNLRVWKENWAAAKPYLDHKRFHLVNYRELVDDPDALHARLAAEMDFLKVTRPFSRHAEHAGEANGKWLNGMPIKLRPVMPDRVGLWRQHLPRLKGQIVQHGDVNHSLIELGYEKDCSWMSLLDGVEPDLRPSDAIEFEAFDRHVTRAWRNTLGLFVYLARRYLGFELSDTGEGSLRGRRRGAAKKDARQSVGRGSAGAVASIAQSTGTANPSPN